MRGPVAFLALLLAQPVFAQVVGNTPTAGAGGQSAPIPMMPSVASPALPLPNGSKICGTAQMRWASSLVRFWFDSTAVGTGTIKISSPILRKITDPRSAWGLP